MTRVGLPTTLGSGLLAAAFATAPAAAGNRLPDFIAGAPIANYYDGVSDDLLTGGLGRSGLQGPAPVIADPHDPSAAELRRLAIYFNYRALIDFTTAGGFGVFYGPNVRADGEVTAEEGLIAGHEFLAYADAAGGEDDDDDDDDGRRVGAGSPANVTLMVQVPAGFDPQRACIVTAPSSGSRGVYGAIGTAGEWGLKRGCAVAYTDKGSGNGAHDLHGDQVTDIQGRVLDAAEAGARSHFTAPLGTRERLAFDAATPDRFAFKHAHSRRNPEADWGRNVLQSIRFALWAINELHGSGERRYDRHNVLVIASSVSNGGGASLRAAERDGAGLIDGVAVSEPNVNPRYDRRFGIVQGDGEPLFAHSRSLYDYTTLLNVFQPCANLAPENAAAPLNLTPVLFRTSSENRCTSLHQLGLLAATDTPAQAREAQRKINGFGINREQNLTQPANQFINVPQGVSVTYANAYARASVTDNLCGYSFGATDAAGTPAALAPEALRALFGTGNGIPPTGGVNLIDNLSAFGPVLERLGVSPTTGLADQDLSGALCLRSLALGVDAVSGERLPRALRGAARELRRSVRRIRASARLRGTPAVIVTGRNDAILPINHSSRAYYGLNQLREGRRSNLRYYEITNAHHLDVLNSFAGFDALFVPLHHYLFAALDLMWAHLTEGAPLPPSQVVVTVPRGAGAPPLSALNLTPIRQHPDSANLIRFEDRLLKIPEGR